MRLLLPRQSMLESGLELRIQKQVATCGCVTLRKLLDAQLGFLISQVKPVVPASHDMFWWLTLIRYTELLGGSIHIDIYCNQLGSKWNWFFVMYIFKCSPSELPCLGAMSTPLYTLPLRCASEHYPAWLIAPHMRYHQISVKMLSTHKWSSWLSQTPPWQRPFTPWLVLFWGPTDLWISMYLSILQSFMWLEWTRMYSVLLNSFRSIQWLWS